VRDNRVAQLTSPIKSKCISHPGLMPTFAKDIVHNEHCSSASAQDVTAQSKLKL
jgi:hypothetical protein